ncbi:MAG: hypothetical protein B6D61_11925 [Bacteroidetes bacterium 4484_249]|nr:MAG: hypothetical protein B6D61_11925 [Bacteroidetes bacterium 4484_249]
MKNLIKNIFMIPLLLITLLWDIVKNVILHPFQSAITSAVTIIILAATLPIQLMTAISLAATSMILLGFGLLGKIHKKE